MKCKHCGTEIHFVREDHWQGWDDEYDCELSYVPILHNHEPEAR